MKSRLTHYAIAFGLALSLFALPARETSAKTKLKFTFQFYDLKVERGGTYLVLKFKSREPCSPFVAASREKLFIESHNGGWQVSNPKKIEKSVFGGFTKKTDHRISLTGLHPGSTYHIRMFPYANNLKNRLPSYKKVKTRNRKVTVQLSLVQMIDDSDANTAGDFGISLFILSQKGSKWTKRAEFNNVIKGQMASGSNIPVSVKRTVKFNHTHLRLGILGIDNDIDGFTTPTYSGVLNRSGTKGPCFPFAGDNDDYEWASGSTSPVALVPNNMEGANLAAIEKFSEPFTVVVDGADTVDLKFKVHGTFTVWYE